jgi:uncharacterized repeat protein (TIGR01451 family)
MLSPFTSHRLFLAALVFVALLGAALPGAAFGEPPAPPTATPTAQPVPYVLGESSTQPDAPTAQPSLASGPTAAPAQSAAPQPSSNGTSLSAASSRLGPMGVQGPIQVDIIAPLTVRAGDLIVYTVAYTNTSASTIYNNIMLEARWTDFYEFQYTQSNAQYCDGITAAGGQCDPSNISGSSVQRVSPCPDYATGNRCYKISSLEPKQSGHFEINIRLGRLAYPQSGMSPLRPAGSARLYLPGTQTISSEDTANSLVIGPVLTLRKTLSAGQASRIYPLQQGTFVLNVGNAAESADQPNGQLRVDARPATDIVVEDYVPEGATYISASPPPESSVGGKLVWRFAGPLNPGQYLPPLTVTFRKDDVNLDCGRLLNGNLNVTSAEYLIEPNTTRYPVPGFPAAIGVVTPMRIASIEANPADAIYGTSSTIAIKVRNYYNQPVNGAQLTYAIQSNASYAAGSATPAPTSVPGVGNGGTVVWTFNMPAGTMDVPTEATFTLRVNVGYINAATNGLATLTPPAGVPSACTTPENGGASAIPRLVLTKTTTADESTKLNGAYVVTRNQDFPYKVTVLNRGITAANGVMVRDQLPTQTGANVVYKAGSARVNGQAIEPTLSTANGGTVLTWSGLNIAPGQTAVITYMATVNGLDYYDYCNTATAALNQESIQYNGNSVCVRINPRITMTKTADRTTANPGDMVSYTITLKNEEATAYTVGIIDDPGYTWESYQVLAGSYDPSPGSVGNGYITWKRVVVQPNQTITQRLQMRLPATCTTANYANEAMFINAQDSIVHFSPVVYTGVSVNCGQLRYSTGASNYNVGLGDKVLFNVNVTNDDKDPASNVKLVDQLPPGFTYLGIDESSPFKLNPQITTGRPDGRDQLEWTVPSLAGNSTITIAFLARAADAVGTHYNWFFIRNPGSCSSQCVTLSNGITVSTVGVNARPLITNEPLVVPDTCALPGEVRTYRVTLVNTNTHSYSGTNVTIVLPNGLRYLNPVGTTPTPHLALDPLGNQLVIWDNLVINKPSDAIATQVVLEMKFAIGQVWGDIPTQVRTTSPDGLIPRKEGAIDPIVRVCPPTPAIAKSVNMTQVREGGELIYQIMLANPTKSPLTTNVTDALPPSLVYVGMLSSAGVPAPTVAGNTLSWPSVTIPAATDTSTGTVLMRLRVRVSGATVGQTIDNTASASSPQIVPPSSTVSVNVVQSVLLPIARR